MQEIIMSIHKKWLDLILSGEKILEIRKTRPNLSVSEFYKIYFYETKSGGGSGKIVATAMCNVISSIAKTTNEHYMERILHDSKLAKDEFDKYIGSDCAYGYYLYSVRRCEDTLEDLGFSRAPQSWCYVSRNKVIKREITEGERCFVIGDIHGHLEELKAILNSIKYTKETDTIIFVGDYVDWGQYSIETIEFIMEMQSQNANVIALLGNHDRMMQLTIEGARPSDYNRNVMKTWSINGGAETIASYNSISPDRQKKIIKWLNSLPLNVDLKIGDQKYIIAHAAAYDCINDTKLSSRCDFLSPTDACVWYRYYHDTENSFGFNRKFKGYTLIHGHTITSTRCVLREHDRIDIDCGAKVIGYDGKIGNLCALNLNDMSRTYEPGEFICVDSDKAYNSPLIN